MHFRFNPSNQITWTEHSRHKAAPPFHRAIPSVPEPQSPTDNAQVVNAYAINTKPLVSTRQLQLFIWPHPDP
jgi:hypothetical protein